MTDADDILDSPYAWGRLALTLLAAVAASAGQWMVVAILPAFEAEFGLSRAQASLPFVATMVGFALGNLMIGRVVDRFGVTRALFLAAGLSVLAYGAALVAGGLWALALAHLVLGLGAAVGFGPLMADISHWFLRRRGFAVALVGSGNYLSGAIWPVLLSPMLAEMGWRAVYLTLAGITVLILPPLALLLRRQIPPQAQAKAQSLSDQNARSTGLSPRALMYLLGFAGICCCVAMSMPQVHIVAYCVGLGYGPAVGGAMLSLMLLGGAISRVISGLVADRLGGVRTLLIGSVLQMIALALYIPWDAMVPLYVISTVFGLSQGGIVPSYALVVREYMPAREAGTRVGFVLMMTIMGMALGGWMSGLIYDLTGSYLMAFLNGIGWNLINIVIMATLLMRASRGRLQTA